ncbi:unnamed protein product, partial [Symbiodinium microadriaticum]
WTLPSNTWQGPAGEKPLPASYDGTDTLTLLQKAYLMVHFTFVIYAPEMQTMHMDARLWGWNLVGYAESLPYANKGSLVQFHDHAALYQHPKSLECALVFEGSDRQDLSDWVYDADIKTSQFCGFEDVHSGFRDKLLAMLRSDDYDQAIRAKLPFCSRVAATGHSMGGAQAELFTACANRRIPKPWQTDALSDHKLVAFHLTGPELLRPFLTEQVPGVVLRNVNNRCLGVEGPMQTASGSALAAERCHAPGPRAAQRWRLGEAGSIVNEATSKCLTAVSLAGEVVRGAWSQQEDIRDSNVRRRANWWMLTTRRSLSLFVFAAILQMAPLTRIRHLDAPVVKRTWVHTPEGLLQQRSVGKCLNAKLQLQKCAFSDQQWEPTADGRLLHKLSGRCLDVSGEVAVDGATFVLNDCAKGVEDAKLQRWGISQHGVLQSLSDVSLCIGVRVSEAGAQDLAVQSCPEEAFEDFRWHFLKGNFLRHVATGMCADVVGSPGTDRYAGIELAPCDNQALETPGIWSFSPEGFLLNQGSDWLSANKCISAHPHGDDPSEVSLDVCDFGTDQLWEISEGRIRNTLGSRKCITLSKSFEPQLQICRNASETQYWKRLDGVLLQNRNAGSCLATVSTGSELELKACSLGDPHQLWESIPSARR